MQVLISCLANYEEQNSSLGANGKFIQLTNTLPLMQPEG
jgi:hypothetical protein